MKGREDVKNERDIILKFTLIKALKELVETGDVSEVVAKTYMKIFDKVKISKNPDDILEKLLSTNTELKNGDARFRFKTIKLELNDKKMNEYIKDIFTILHNKDQGVSPAIDAAISMKNTIHEARMMAEGMAEIKARQSSQPSQKK